MPYQRVCNIYELILSDKNRKRIFQIKRQLLNISFPLFKFSNLKISHFGYMAVLSPMALFIQNQEGIKGSGTSLSQKSLQSWL